jgi:multiple sugar transport system substrate-binding protein
MSLRPPVLGWSRVRILLLAAALGAILYLILPSPTIVIAVHQGVEGVPMKKVAEQFCRERYNGKVQIVELGSDDLFAAEWSAVTGDDAPFPFSAPPRFDVIMLDDPWLPAFVTRDPNKSYLQPLDERQLAGKRGIQDFPEPCLRVCRAGGRFFAMPFAGNSQLLCRTRDVARPASWNDLAGRASSNDKLAYAMRLGPGNSVVTDFLSILWFFAPESFQDDYSTLDEKKAAEAFRMFHKLAGKQRWASAVTQDVDVAVSLALHSASTGMVWNAWAMALQQFEETSGDFEFGWFPGQDQKPVLGAWLLAVPKNAPHSKEAKSFIEYAIGEEQLKLAATFGNPPPRFSVFAEYKDRYLPMLQSLQNARPRPRTPCWREVETVLSKALSNWREETSDAVVSTLKQDLKEVRAHDLQSGCVTP